MTTMHAIVATWTDGAHEISHVVSAHTAREDAEQALRTIHSGADVADLVTFSIEELRTNVIAKDETP